MQTQLAYLKSVIEGEPDIERWSAWFERNSEVLNSALPRTTFLRLKFDRIKAIPAILERHEIPFTPSDRYAYLGGLPGLCNDCGAAIQYTPGFDIRGGFAWCPEGCFRLHALSRPERK
jgi:hypothetical protein